MERRSGVQTPCFTLKNISFSYGEKRVLKNLSLTIPKGKIVTLMGSNGCGKSTLFQLLTGNLKPAEGRICLEQIPLEQIGRKSFARKVAIVHQNNTAPGDLTAEQLTAYGRIPYTRLGRSVSKEEDVRMIERAMKITGTWSLRKRQLQALSGGQRQRVWIAMAIAQGTKILLLDEPTTYLDVRCQLQILRLVRMLNRRYGITVLMVLHDINQALYYSDEIVALSAEGTLIARGDPQKVISPEMLKRVYGIELPILMHGERKLALTV